MMWDSLPADVIIGVAERLPIPDVARLRAVCTSWASAVKGFRPRAGSCRFPWLYPIRPFGMPADVPIRLSLLNAPQDVRLPFFNIPEDRCYRLPLVDNIVDNIWGGAATGISVPFQHRDGWISLRPHKHCPVLLNPLSGARLPLPSTRTLPTIPTNHIHPSYRRSNVEYTVIPCPAQNVAFVIYGYPSHLSNCFLAFARPGDNAWTRVSDPRSITFQTAFHSRRFSDVVYHQGRFYALYVSGELLAFDIRSTPLTTSILALNKHSYAFVDGGVHYMNSPRYMFLASSPSGDLLHVRPRGNGVNNFVVMKLDERADRWVEITNLGESCLFIDESQAMMISPQDVLPWARRNCIYFAGSAVQGNIYLPGTTVIMTTANTLQMSELRNNNHLNYVADVRVFEVGRANSLRLSIPENFRLHRSLFWFRPSFV